ncbi:MAG: hypothetical protein KGO49_03560 [Gammaproteobacteria bacterium]|nr:hypothetical protein [Gammaproteobacteria bacterium]
MRFENTKKSESSMNLAKTFIIVAIFGGAYTYWHHHHPITQYSAAITSNGGTTIAKNDRPQITTNGFAYLPPALGQNASKVYVVTVEGCPSEDAQRANLLAKNLMQRGIPVQQIDNVSFSYSERPDDKTMQRMTSIMQGPIPIVFINGYAKSDPSLDEVIAEYHSNNQ